MIEMEDTNITVLLYQDDIELKDGKITAIISQLYEFDEDNGYSFGLGFKVLKDKIKLSNERVFLGEIRNFLMF